MEGISKETLEDYRNIARSIGDLIRAQVISDLLRECTELDPWLPIESAPLRKAIRLYSREEGQLDNQLFHEEDRKCFTHWREVTEDPKE